MSFADQRVQPVPESPSLAPRMARCEQNSTVFGDILAMNMPAPDHSEGEQRFLVLGMSRASRLVVVSYAERPPRTRIIGARLATSHERRKYEND